MRMPRMTRCRFLSTKSANSSSRTSSPHPHGLQKLLQKVAGGEISVEMAMSEWRNIECSNLHQYAKLDGDREARTGFPEVVYGEGKTPLQIHAILQRMQLQDHSNITMATRVTPDQFEYLESRLKDFVFYPTSRIIASKEAKDTSGQRKGVLAVLCAGTSDVPVAEEAAITAELSGYQVNRLYDVGVAGIHRLLRNRKVIDEADVVIAVAGMDGAMPGVVGGLTSNPVIAVPTSIGYGASFNGIGPLLTMLNACSPGVGVVNIDNGFGAAVLAGQILSKIKN